MTRVVSTVVFALLCVGFALGQTGNAPVTAQERLAAQEALNAPLVANNPEVARITQQLEALQAQINALQEVKLPAYLAIGGAFNQMGTPRWNVWGSAIVPVWDKAGMYLSTTTDVVPVKKVVDGRTIWTPQFSVRQGVHKLIYQKGRFAGLLGGDGGLAMSQASPEGTNVNAAASVTGTAVIQLKSWLGVAVPVRGLWVAGVGWNVIPEIGLVFKP